MYIILLWFPAFDELCVDVEWLDVYQWTLHQHAVTEVRVLQCLLSASSSEVNIIAIV